MTEREIVESFASDLTQLENILNEKNLRVYSTEFQIRTEDGVKRADLVIESDTHPTPMKNKMYVLEFKKEKIDYKSAVSQVNRYAYFLQKQLYRRDEVDKIIVAPEFSNWELKSCRENKILALQFDKKGNIRLL